MARNLRKRSSTLFSGLLLSTLILSLSNTGTAGNPHSAYYSAENNKIFWFIQTSDTHIGASGTADSNNLKWLVTQARQIIAPEFVIVTGDLTDSTNGNFLGIPNGPYQKEWDEYRSILTTAGVTSNDYYDIPGNHDAYSDRLFAYYLNNSIQGKMTGRTQASFVKEFPFGTYHFLGINTADNTGNAFSLSWPYGDYAGLDTGELTFLSSEMKYYSTSDLTLVFGHHPLADTGNSSDTYVYYGLEEFLSYMNGYQASLYGYGHTHAFSEAFFIPTAYPDAGFFYFNVASLGKSTSNQYTIMAIDCNGISSKTLTMNTWPAVVITAPVDVNLGGYTPYAYTVPAGTTNPIRALVFDPLTVTSVQYRIDGGTQWFNMTPVDGNPKLYEATWNASLLANGSHTIEVKATSASGTRNDIITTKVSGPVQTPRIGATFIDTGKYLTTGSRKSTTSTWTSTSTFIQGDKVIFRLGLKDGNGSAIPGVTVKLDISGPATTTITSAPSNSQGVAEASWQTTAPNKRSTGGTATGNYSATVSGITASGFVWDGSSPTQSFTIDIKH